MGNEYRELLREWNVEGVHFSLYALPEHEEVRGNAIASGDDEEDRAHEDAIIAEIEAGNMLAWCTLLVTASMEDCPVIGREYLSCVSIYGEGRDLIDDACEYYADDMASEARAELEAYLGLAVKAYAKLGAVR